MKRAGAASARDDQPSSSRRREDTVDPLAEVDKLLLDLDTADKLPSSADLSNKVTGWMAKTDAAGALRMLDGLCDQWRLRPEERGASFEAQTRHMFDRVGLQYTSNMSDDLGEEGSFGLRRADSKIHVHELAAMGLYHRLHALGLLPERGAHEDQPPPDDDLATNMKRIVKVLEMVFYAKRVVLSAFQAKLAVHTLHSDDGALGLAADIDTRLGSWGLRFRYINNKITPMQNMLLFLLDGAMEMSYRKSNGWVYEPIYVDGRNTHAWRPVMEIREFVYSLLQKETCWDQWCNATASGLKNISSAVEYLTNCRDYQLPDLHKQRGVYAFSNGVYMARTDRFYGCDAVLSDDVVAVKFIDDTFVDYDCDWRLIPTPFLQSIMDYQQFSADVCAWMYVMLGRLLYALNELDSWQVIPFFKGAASSGKCFAAGTRVMMHDGATRAVEDVAVGDLLMGDDGTPRRVLTLARGEDDLFDLLPRRKGYPTHTVTREHVLCLKFTNQGSRSSWKYGSRVQYFDRHTRCSRSRKFVHANVDAAAAFVGELDRDEVFEMTVDEYLGLPEYLRRYLVAYRAAVNFGDASAPLFDPWTIGAWIGDGHSAGARITAADDDIVSALQAAVAPYDLVVTKGAGQYLYGVSQPSGSRAKGGNAFLEALWSYDLVENKHIPAELKTGSRATRMEVLAGILDTDGWYNPGGYYEVTQKRRVIAEDIVFVARSLGFGATFAPVTKSCTYLGGKRTGEYFRVNIFGTGLCDIPLRLERKRASSELKPRKDALRYGFDVTPAGRQAYFGFETDGNHRFLLGDFTVTHNSTIILKVCKSFYDAQDVGVLSNNIERKFGLSAFYDKCLFLAPELRNDLALEQAEFQSVVSGEDLQVNVKHKCAFSTTWTVPGALAGNEVPAWADASGSVQRRVVLFEFGRAVANGDMKLGEKLQTELPAILAKCNKAYLEMAGRYSHVNVWTVLPAYFKATRDQLAQSVNSVEAFLASTEVMHGSELYCPMEDFRAALKSFEISNNYRSNQSAQDFFRGPLWQVRPAHRARQEGVPRHQQDPGLRDGHRHQRPQPGRGRPRVMSCNGLRVQNVYKRAG